ncbi:MAG: hypothetical protein AXW14_03830 [Alteromonas sp. Nap_26]|nr:MAG: hypothetical protein AXW14_03830 [Alteromonas sp. Nap_26]
MNQLPFLLSEFKRELISLLIKQCFGAAFPDIRQKRQVNYLFSYLDKLCAKTVICETDYVDREYLDDYANYYVKCFGGYSSKCARLHFFSEEFSHEDFRELLSNSNTRAERPSINEKKLNECYLGFVVIKPLPMTFIGRTCLKRYAGLDQKEYKYAVSRSYKANLFGIELEVNSVAFQEQDKVVAACATTALWTSLHALSNFTDVKNIPSPSEITLNALSEQPLNINGFPNTGLTSSEVIRALEKSKLKHHQVAINLSLDRELELLFDAAKAYINSGIPIILGVKVFDSEAREKGEHLVSLLGYEVKNNRVEKFFIHDDRIGPYAKAKRISSENAKRIGIDAKLLLEVETPDENRNTISEFLVPNSLIVATYHKVRIPFWFIDYTAKQFKKQIGSIFERSKVKDAALEINISMVESSLLKNQILNNRRIRNRYDNLVSHWPRFVWKLDFLVNGEQSFDFLYDATDIPQGNAFVGSVIYKQDLYDGLKKQLIALLDGMVNEDPQDWNNMESFFAQTLFSLRQDNYNFHEKLDQDFGDLRPPKYLKDQEFTSVDVTLQKERVIFHSPTLDRRLHDLFIGDEKLIWVIADNGELIVGKDKKSMGHPTLTGAKPARIAGEIILGESGVFYLNHKSGRYSNHYTEEQKFKYLENVRKKYEEIFHKENYVFEIIE